MTSRLDDGHRRLIPRWRYTARTVLGYEHAGDPRDARASLPPSEPVIPFVDEWRHSRSLAAAADAISVAIVAGEPRLAVEPSEWVLTSVDVPPELRRAAAAIVSPMESPSASSEVSRRLDVGRLQARDVIRTARARLAEFPRNVARWLDLSRAHVVLGQRESALRAMNVALSLAPDHRVVLRAAIRLLVHVGRTDEAAAMLHGHPRTKVDPWLMSLEVSLSEILNQAPRHLILARRFLRDSGLPPGHMTELASAVATFDGGQGDLKRARKLHRFSLLAPTDNVLAQVGWLRQTDAALPRIAGYDERGAIEAEVWTRLVDGEWEAALDASYRWQNDEPYSARPALAGSFVATSILGDDLTGIAFAKAGLEGDRDDPLLLNNLAVALARNGQLDEAQRVFGTIRPGTRLAGHIHLATRGLLKYAAGLPEEGATDYRDALRLVDGGSPNLVLEASWLDTQARWARHLDADIERRVTAQGNRTSDRIAHAIAKRAAALAGERRRGADNGRAAQSIRS